MSTLLVSVNNLIYDFYERIGPYRMFRVRDSLNPP